MTKVKVLIRFKDKFIPGRYYEKDSVVEFEDEARVAGLAKRGLVEVVKPPQTKKSTTKDENLKE